MPFRMVFVGVAAFAPLFPLRAQDPARGDSATPVDPIVVTVTRGAESVDRVPHGISVLGRDEIVRGGPGTSLAAALSIIPGVTARNRFNPAQDERIAIRGFGARSAFGIRGVRILLDGIPQTLPDGQGQLTNIDLRRVSRVEVLRGVSSALHGNASGGVVSVWSDPVAGPPLQTDARVFYGTDDLFGMDLGATASNDRGWIAVRGSRTRSDGTREQGAFETWRGSLRGSLLLGGRTQLLAAVHLADTPRAEDPGGLNADELAEDPTQANPGHVSVDARKDVMQGQAGLTLRHVSSGGGRFDATVFGLRRELLNPLTFATIAIDRWAYGARAVAALPLPGPVDAEVSVGADAQWQRDDRVNTAPDGSTVTRDQFEAVRELGPFLQVRVTPVSRLAVTAGGRYDDVRFRADDRLLTDGDQSGVRSMSAWSGTIGVVIDAHPAVAPYASVGNGFEAPTTTELANQPDGSDGFNPDLQPQRATQVELGVRGSRGPVAYGVGVFQADVRDALIPFEVPAVPGRQFFRNAGKTRHRGVELNLTVRPLPGVRLVGAYTFLQLEFVDFATDDDVFDGNTIPGVPRHFVAGAASVRQGAVRFQIDARASSSVFVDDANTVQSESWFVADLRGDLTIPAGGWHLAPYAGVENVFGERYVEAVRVNAGFGRVFEPAGGRRFFVGAELRGG